MKLIRDALIIAWMRFYPEVKRQPLLQILLATTFGAFPIFFIWIFGSKEMIDHGIVGAFVGGLSFIGVSAGIQDVAWDRYVKLREMMVAMPIHPMAYALGIAISALLFSTPGLIIFTAVAAWFGILNLQASGWIIASLLLAWSSMSAIGFTISTYLRQVNIYTLNLVSNLLGFVLVFLTPVYYPAYMLGRFDWIGLLTPSSNAAGLIRAYLGLSSSPQVGLTTQWSILIVTTALFILLASLKARWRDI